MFLSLGITLTPLESSAVFNSPRSSCSSMVWFLTFWSWVFDVLVKLLVPHRRQTSFWATRMLPPNLVTRFASTADTLIAFGSSSGLTPKKLVISFSAIWQNVQIRTTKTWLATITRSAGLVMLEWDWWNTMWIWGVLFSGTSKIACLAPWLQSSGKILSCLSTRRTILICFSICAVLSAESCQNVVSTSRIQQPETAFGISRMKWPRNERHNASWRSTRTRCSNSTIAFVKSWWVRVQPRSPKSSTSGIPVKALWQTRLMISIIVQHWLDSWPIIAKPWWTPKNCWTCSSNARTRSKLESRLVWTRRCPLVFLQVGGGL